MVALIGLGELPSFASAKSFVRVSATFTPNKTNEAVYDTLFAQYQQLYRSLSAVYKKANGKRFTEEAN